MHALQTYTLALVATVVIYDRIPMSLSSYEGFNSRNVIACAQQNDSSKAMLTVYFTTGFKSDTIGVDIDNVALIHDREIDTDLTTDLATAILIYRRADILVARIWRDSVEKVIGMARTEAVVSVYHMNRTYSYNVDFQKGKWLLVSLRDTIRFELLNRQPYFD